MDRAHIDYWIDVGLLVSFLGVAITGIIKLKSIAASLGITYGTPIFTSLSRLHDWSGVIMAILVIVHLILHHEWISTVSKQIFSKQAN